MWIPRIIELSKRTSLMGRGSTVGSGMAKKAQDMTTRSREIKTSRKLWSYIEEGKVTTSELD